MNVVDPIARKGYRFKGAATVLADGELFEEILAFYESGDTPLQNARARVRHIVLMTVGTSTPALLPRLRFRAH